MNTLNERIKKLRKGLDLTQQEFAEKIGTSRNNIAGYETGKRSPSEAVITLICREFNVNETWLRTGEGKMSIPKEEDAWSEVVKQRGLTQGDRILIEKFMDLKPSYRQAVMDYMEKAVAALNAGKDTSVPATTGQELTEADIAAKVAELERQNRDLAAKVAAMEEEDALLGITDASSKSPSVSVGNIKPVDKVKK